MGPSRETITDYSLGVGDLLRLRVLDLASGRFHSSRFTWWASFRSSRRHRKTRSWSPTSATCFAPPATAAPTSSSYGRPATPSPSPDASRRRPGARGTSVRNIRQQAVQTVSSITTVDLSGISRIESAFAVILAGPAMGLFVAIGVAERRREFATMAAIGASLRSDLGVRVVGGGHRARRRVRARRRARLAARRDACRDAAACVRSAAGRALDPLVVPRRARRGGPRRRRRGRGDRSTPDPLRCRSGRYCGSSDRASRHPAGRRRRASLDRQSRACARRGSRSRPR